MDHRIPYILSVNSALDLLVKRLSTQAAALTDTVTPITSLTPRQVTAVFAVYAAGKMSLTDLQKHLHISSSSASLLVDRLVKKEVLRREISTSDRRMVRITVEPQAMAYIERMDRSLADYLGSAADTLGPELVEKWYQIARLLEPVIESALSQESGG